MTRPDTDAMWKLMFDDRDRVRPEARPQIIGDVLRCSSDRGGRHLQFVAFATRWGVWAAWHPADFRHTPRSLWADGWLDEEPDEIEVTCRCGLRRRVDLRLYRAMR